jgi:polar amino acid transport system substrate-binding protein
VPFPLPSSSVVSTMANDIPPNIVTELAPGGRLRAAINFGNGVLAQKDKATGEPRGVTAALSRELGRRLGVPVEFVAFDQAGKVFDALASGAWDIAFLAIDPLRAAEINFTAPYVVIEGKYLVPASSPVRSVADVDRDGLRIALARGSAYDLHLTRTLEHATLVRAPDGIDALDMFLGDKLDVAAGVKQPIVAFAKAHGDRAGDGDAQGKAGRGALSQPLRRGDEGVRLRRPGARGERPGGCRGGAAVAGGMTPPPAEAMRARQARFVRRPRAQRSRCGQRPARPMRMR